MKQRILVAVVGVPALLAVLCAAPDWATLALLMGLCIIASHELLAAVLPPEKTRRWWGLAATLAVFVVANVYFSHERFAGTAAAGLMPWLLAALVVVVFLCMVLEYGKKEEMDFTALCAILVAGAAIPLALSCLLRLRMLEHGAGLVLIPLVAAFMSDTMALFGGMLFGKTKLAPVVSPKKTREGAVSGLVGGMGWVIVMAVAVIIAFVMLLMVIAMPKFKLMQKLVDNVNLVSREILTGLSVIRAFGREKKEEERFDEANKKLTKTMLFTNRTMTFMMPSMMFIMNGLSVLIVWVAAHRIDAGVMQVGSMTAFITYSMLIVMSFLMLTMMSVMLPRAMVAADRIDEVINTHSSIEDSENPETIESAKGVVEFNHVNFMYPGAKANVLEDITFKAEPGKTTAIIGSTGCGKSTLVNLIPRLYDVTGGSITIDGHDIRNISMHDLRSELGYVPQKGMLFSGTIASNLRFGNPDASDEDVVKAAQIAQATEFIDNKAEKYDSPIAQGGTNVSGGQKQRLSIARAIAKHPRVFIFDDSFSALDLKTDAILRKELAANVSDATVIIVAQRISTILHADQILVMDDGKIVGKGTHEELMKTCETYQQIASSQLSAKELGKEA